MIPLAKPWIDDAERGAIESVLTTGMLVQGKKVQEFESLLAGAAGRTYAVAVSSGTAALELALQVLDIGAGDEVLCPALTWPSPAHAIMLRGATPVFVDVEPGEWNTTGAVFAAARTRATKAAIVIDQFGFPARAAEIKTALPDLPIVEDAACALGSQFAEGPCGGFGTISCMSFHPRKIITTGEGGVCLTDEPSLAERLRVVRDHGRLPGGRFSEPAGNYRLTEIAAAMGIAQMAKLDEIVRRRQAIADKYRLSLDSLLTFQRVAEGATSNFQTLGALLNEASGEIQRNELVQSLRKRDIEIGTLSYAAHKVGSSKAQSLSLPHAESIAARGFALPLYPTMEPEAVDAVIEAIRRELP